MSRCSLVLENVISHVGSIGPAAFLLGALMSFTVAGVQVFRSGVDAVMSCIGLYVERPPVQIDVMGGSRYGGSHGERVAAFRLHPGQIHPALPILRLYR